MKPSDFSSAEITYDMRQEPKLDITDCQIDHQSRVNKTYRRFQWFDSCRFTTQ